MLAKQETPMKASSTVRGRVPAKLSTFVINMRSMLVLLSAEEMVKPPMSNMMVGENIVEKTYLKSNSQCVDWQRLDMLYLLCSIRSRHGFPIFRTNDLEPDEQHRHCHGGSE